jgi:hypothetical protein
MAHTVDSYRLDALAQAMAAGHKIGACRACGGPDVHSKIRPAARCFRCGLARETAFVVPLEDTPITIKNIKDSA